MFRARLSLFALENRENPSGPAPIDPIEIPGTPPAPEPAPTTPVIIDIATGIATGVTDPTVTPTTPTSSLNPGDPLYVPPSP